MPTPRRTWMFPTRRMALGLVTAAVVLGGLSACSTFTSVGADVSSYGQWPADRKGASYVFERLPSQQVQADFQGRVEAAAAPMLARKGFVLAASPDKADVLIQVAAQSRLYENPYRRSYDGGLFGGQFGLGGGIWGGHGGVGIGINLEPAQTQMQVDVLIRDRRSNQTLYETHAVHERYGSMVESLLPVLFEAALLDFPAQGISPRRVLIDTAASAPKP
jgi:predicted small secreted protein